MKDVGLRIRVQRELREQFLEACRTQDKPAAQVLREFMRVYVTTNALDLSDSKKQMGSSFPTEPKKAPGNG